MKKIRTALLGASGRMGHLLTQRLQADAAFDLVARIDTRPDEIGPHPIASLGEAPEFDLLIDFSHPTATAAALIEMEKRRAAWLVATTGLSDDLKGAIAALGARAAILIASNTSLGIAVMTRLCAQAAAMLDGWDVEIVEAHHRNKIDAPSGTALSLAQAIASVRDAHGAEVPASLVTQRGGVTGPRQDNEIGIASIRGGTVPGEHRAMWLGEEEMLEIHHSAQSRDIFANGACRLAKWLVQKPVGLYAVDDFIDDLVPTCHGD